MTKKIMGQYYPGAIKRRKTKGKNVQKLKMYSIRDTKGEVWNTPFFQKTHGEAERSFKALVLDEKSMVSKYPEDFDLYYVGDWNQDDAVLIPLTAPQHVLKASAVPRATPAQLNAIQSQSERLKQ